VLPLLTVHYSPIALHERIVKMFGGAAAFVSQTQSRLSSQKAADKKSEIVNLNN